ncbi:MAG: hypothetical protein CTR55_02495 [Pseudomonas sp.]|uniref:hypothetical protein n=1 Tax=Pseudomonas sp. TaxID=306 RepID=UPI000CC7DC4F|nr:hypothetical protein [Pseudomonas sp.]PJI50657.1 MAG: hypothetical protein CTR55_02495 [Pseudomonas sp.]
MKQSWMFILLALAPYAISFALPALHTEERWGEDRIPVSMYGWEVALFGWSAIIGSGKYWSMAWYANPLLLGTIAFYAGGFRVAQLTAIVGLLVACTSPFVSRIFSDKEPPSIYVTGMGIGFYFWLAAFVIMLLATFIKR